MRAASGFPYSATEDNLAPHRGLVIHTAREFYNKALCAIIMSGGVFFSELIELLVRKDQCLGSWGS